MAAVTLLLCVFAVAAIAFYQRSPNLSPRASVALFAGLVILGSLLALSNLLNLGSWNSVQQVLVVVEAVFGAWLLYWLNTKQVAQFFRRGGTVVAG
jgi:hypothetical protein